METKILEVEKSVKLSLLKQELAEMKKVLIAFSAGVDSSFLLKIAQEVLGNNVLAVTVRSAAFPARELKEASEFCRQQGIEHRFITANELELEEYRKNSPERCYICKKYLFGKIKEMAEKSGFPHIAEGSNLDDLADYRPGRRALSELGIHSPLLGVGLTKAEIRELAKSTGLLVWDKPSLACLASRIPYGEEITKEKLEMVDQAEQVLFDLGFKQFRVRHHGDIARIEVFPTDRIKILDPKTAEHINKSFEKIGFLYTALDLKGYRSGSLNEKLLECRKERIFN